MKATEISEDELFQAIEQSLSEGRDPGLEPGCTTTPRVMARFNISRMKARKYLNKMIVDGLLVPDTVLNTDMWGHTQHVPGFRMVKNDD